MARTLILLLLGAFWLGALFVARHPLLDAFKPPQDPSKLELELERLDLEVDPEVDVALWWPERGEEGMASLGHLWARAGYALTPRRVFPLLTPREAESLALLTDGLRADLARSARELLAGTAPPTVVLAWGDQDCFLEDFPHLAVRRHDGPLCLLETKPPEAKSR
ncbi:MAG: hypothetical protein AAFY88_02475 [Acidobacteriota bacterium]